MATGHVWDIDNTLHVQSLFWSYNITTMNKARIWQIFNWTSSLQICPIDKIWQIAILDFRLNAELKFNYVN